MRTKIDFYQPIVICNYQGFASQAWNIEKYFPDSWAIKTGNFYGKVIEPTPGYSKIALAFGAHINGVASQLLTFIVSLCQMLRPDPVRFFGQPGGGIQIFIKDPSNISFFGIRPLK